MVRNSSGSCGRPDRCSCLHRRMRRPGAAPGEGFLVMLDEAYRTRNMLPVRPDWLAARREEVIEPGMPIVDPHHHLWDMPQCPFLIEDLAADTGAGHNVVATVYVEAHT